MASNRRKLIMKINQTYITVGAGALLGLIVGGSAVGAIIGGIFGYYLGRHLLSAFNRPRGWHGTVQAVFFRTTFRTLGHLAKADGRVSEQEIATARNIMHKLGLNDASKRQAIKFFNEGKQSGFNLEAAIREFKLCCWYKPMLYTVFMEFLMQMASVDGGPRQQQILQSIAKQLGVTISSSSGRRSWGQGDGSFYAQHSLNDDYNLLNVNKTAGHAEVKKAYRKRMNENHPDKLIAKGVPEEMIKLATEKTQQIKEAYERICTARGFKK